MAITKASNPLMSMDVIRVEDLIMYVSLKMGKREVAQFAKDIGLPKQRIYEILSGTQTKPSKRTLEALGLRIVYQITDGVGLDGTAPKTGLPVGYKPRTKREKEAHK